MLSNSLTTPRQNLPPRPIPESRTLKQLKVVRHTANSTKSRNFELPPPLPTSTAWAATADAADEDLFAGFVTTSDETKISTNSLNSYADQILSSSYCLNSASNVRQTSATFDQLEFVAHCLTWIDTALLRGVADQISTALLHDSGDKYRHLESTASLSTGILSRIFPNWPSTTLAEHKSADTVRQGSAIATAAEANKAAPNAISSRMAARAHHLLSLSENWDGQGAAPLPPEVVNGLLHDLDAALYGLSGLPLPSLIPGADGSLLAEWRTASQIASLDRYPDGERELVIENRQSKTRKRASGEHALEQLREWATQILSR